MINYKKSKTLESIIIIPNLFSNEILNFSQLVQITCHYVEIINRLLNVGLSFLIFYDCATPVGRNGEKGPFSEGKVIAKTHIFFFLKSLRITETPISWHRRRIFVDRFHGWHVVDCCVQ